MTWLLNLRVGLGTREAVRPSGEVASPVNLGRALSNIGSIPVAHLG